MKKMTHNIVSSIKDVYNSLVYKVSWPTRQELSNSTTVVITVSLIMALIVFVIDFSFESIVTFFYEKIK